MENDVKNVSGAQFPQPAEEFAVRSATSAYKFLTEGVPPPFPCYVGVDDRLFVSVVSDVGLNTANITLRILRPDGIIVPIFLQVPTTSLSIVKQANFQLIEGFILSAGVCSGSVTGITSTTYCVVSLVRTPLSQGAQHEVLCAGYLNAVTPLSFPNGTIQRQSDGPGQPRSIGIGNPAAGSDFTFTVGAGSRVRVVSLSATLTTAVAVANRNVELVIDDGANVLAEITSGFSQAASLVNDYTWMDSGPRDALFDNVVVLPLPANLILPPGFRVRSETTGIQAADQWSSIALLVHGWTEQG